MVLLMYWDESEDRRKARREERLRSKKLGLPEPAQVSGVATAESSEKILEVLSKQTALFLDQSKKIDDLSKIILEQQHIIEEIREKDPAVIVTDSNASVPRGPEGNEKKDAFVKLEDIDVNVIDTSGIESAGEAGVVSQGQNIMSQVEKLKRFRKKR